MKYIKYILLTFLLSTCLFAQPVKSVFSAKQLTVLDSLMGTVSSAPILNYDKARYKSTDNTSTKILNIIGNSISEGTGVTDWTDSSYVGLLKKRYKEFYGISNEGYVNTDSTSNGKFAVVTLSGFTSYSLDGNYLGGSYTTSSTSGDSVKYVYTGGDAYLVYKTVTGGGQLQVNLDGTNVDTINTATGTASNFSVSDIITATEGSHTLKFIKLDNLPTTISGVYFADDLDGFMINNYSRGSILLVNIADNVLYKEAQANGVIVELGVNDRSNSANVDSLKAKLRRLLGYVEANNGTAIVTDMIYGEDQSDVYKTALREVTAEFPQFTFIDFANYFYKSSAFDYGSIRPNDGVHPTSYGAKIIADKLSEVLGISKPDSINNENFNYLSSEMMHNTTGYDNMSAGFGSLRDNTTGYGNTSFGIGALRYNTEGYSNLAVGKNTLIWNTTGSSNTAIGSNALGLNISGIGNVGIGTYAGYGNRTQSYNTAIGANALLANVSGHNNLAIGYGAMQKDTAGRWNIAIGNESLRDNLVGDANVAIGYNSLLKNTGSGNTAIGFQSLLNQTSPSFNTSIGYNSSITLTTGQNNTAIGHNALLSNSTGSGNVAIGEAAGYNETGSNKLYINNDSSSTPLIWGDFSTDSLRVNGDLFINGNLYLPNAPTDSTSCITGQIYFDSTTGALRRKF